MNDIDREALIEAYDYYLSHGLPKSEAIYHTAITFDVSNGDVEDAIGQRKDYGMDVEAFNRDHSHKAGCHLARTAGSDYTECDTHDAWVKHGVPPLLRDI